MVVIRRKSDGKFYTERWRRADPDGWTEHLDVARIFYRTCDAKKSNLFWYHRSDMTDYEIVPVNLSLA